MKADIKLCSSSYSVVTLPVFPAWSRISSGHMHVVLDRPWKMCFSDEATIHVCGTVSRHNCHMGKWTCSLCYWTWTVVCFDEE